MNDLDRGVSPEPSCQAASQTGIELHCNDAARARRELRCYDTESRPGLEDQLV
jgi:hypothetical protein